MEINKFIYWERSWVRQEDQSPASQQEPVAVFTELIVCSKQKLFEFSSKLNAVLPFVNKYLSHKIISPRSCVRGQNWVRGPACSLRRGPQRSGIIFAESWSTVQCGKEQCLVVPEELRRKESTSCTLSWPNCKGKAYSTFNRNCTRKS